MVDFPTEYPLKIKGKRAQPKAPLIFATQMKKYLRKKQKFFAVDIFKFSNESKSGGKEPIVVEDFLANHPDIFPGEFRGELPETEVDHAFKLMPSLTQIAKALYRHYFEKIVELEPSTKRFVK